MPYVICRVFDFPVFWNPSRSLPSGVAGIDRQHRACDVTGLFSEQAVDHIGHVIDLGKTLQRATLAIRSRSPRSKPCVISISRKPGATALTVIPSNSASRLSERVKPLRPALVVL